MIAVYVVCLGLALVVAMYLSVLGRGYWNTRARLY